MQVERTLELNAGHEVKENKNAHKNQVEHKNLKIEHVCGIHSKIILEFL